MFGPEGGRDFTKVIDYAKREGTHKWDGKPISFSREAFCEEWARLLAMGDAYDPANPDPWKP